LLRSKANSDEDTKHVLDAIHWIGPHNLLMQCRVAHSTRASEFATDAAWTAALTAAFCRTQAAGSERKWHRAEPLLSFLSKKSCRPEDTQVAGKATGAQSGQSPDEVVLNLQNVSKAYGPVQKR